MRLTTSLICIILLLTACSRKDEDERPALERAQEKLQASLDTAEAEARKALGAAMKRWHELQPEAERAIASLEERVDRLVKDPEALKRLPSDALEKVQKHLYAMREKLAEAKTAYEHGDAVLAVEKADAVQQDREAVEELLVERPDPSG
jgi:hypothetical protein